MRRIEALERSQTAQPPLPGREEVAKPLAGLRIALDVRQDHPNAPFATLLKERLSREDALVDSGNESLTISGILTCNGYAEVYYRAEIVIQAGGQTLFTLDEKPPHGDRPENLALELVERLKTEWAKHERRAALRELND